jgi:DHA2 family multidrug resistance protein
VSPWLVALAVLLPTFMEVLDTSIVNVALPHMAGSFSATENEITWVLTSYLVSNAIVLPMSGWLAGLFGRKRYLIGCVSLFTCASLLCATADSLKAMVGWRVLQGAAGGALQPLSQAILLESFPVERRGSAMAAWGMGIVVAPVIAPLVGGYVTDNYSWHWIFLMNVPIGVIAVLLILAFVFDPPYAERRRIPIDAMGVGLLIVAIGALQILLDRGQEKDWFASPLIRNMALASALSFLALLVHEWRARHPVIDLRVFRDRTFSAGTTVMFLFGFGLYATLTLIPLFVQGLLGYPAFESGLVISPRGLGVITIMALAGILLRRFDARWVILTGIPFLVVSGMMMAHFGAQTRFYDIVLAMVIQGIGMGFVFVPLSTATMSNIAPERMSHATGMFNLMRNVGGSVGIAVTQTVLARRIQLHHLVLGEHVSPFNQNFHELAAKLVSGFMSQTADVGAAHRQALALIARLVDQQAAFLAYGDVFWIFAGVFLAVAPIVLLMRPAWRPGGKSPIH